MGDHRAMIHIRFDIHGKLYEHDWWINYCPDDSTGVDQRVADWFDDCWRDALSRYNKMIEKATAKDRERETERAERAELARLKGKYEAPESQANSPTQ